MPRKRRALRRRRQVELTELELLGLETGLSYFGALASNARARRVDHDLAREALGWLTAEQVAEWQEAHPGMRMWAERLRDRRCRQPDVPGPYKAPRPKRRVEHGEQR